MNVLLSAAVTADGALDDCTAERLRISSPEDWSEVLRLRAQHDAIMVGAGTIRSDNPRLVIADEALRAQRTRQGMEADIAKVTVTRTGCLDPLARFFTCGAGRKLVFSTIPLPHLEGIAEVVVSPNITAALIVTELEKRGLRSLFVEGGAQILRMFLAEHMADRFRLAVTPSLRVDDPRAPRLDIEALLPKAPRTTQQFGTTEVTTYALRESHPEDEGYLRQALDASRLCTPSATSYCVGAVVVTREGGVFTGYTHETSPTHHAEQEAIGKAQNAGADLLGATIYASMEPCSTRKSEPESCSELILRLGFARTVFAAYEPDCFVECRGAQNLRQGGVEVRVMPELADEVRFINSHLIKNSGF